MSFGVYFAKMRNIHRRRHHPRGSHRGGHVKIMSERIEKGHDSYGEFRLQVQLDPRRSGPTVPEAVGQSVFRGGPGGRKFVGKVRREKRRQATEGERKAKFY